MIVLSGGDLLLPDRVVTGGSLLVHDGRIVAIESRPVKPAGATVVEVRDCYVAPGFIDTHVHGLQGCDTLDGGDAVASIAAVLPQYGVTAFCPTSVACAAADLRTFLEQVRALRVSPVPGAARVLPAHLESNFVNPEYGGAQPAACLRVPGETSTDGTFSARDVLDVIDAFRPDVGTVTLAPELPGGLELIRALVGAGHRVSLGHSAADVDAAIAAFDAGASSATHLFNRMAPMTHRAPGLAGAVLARDEITAELICDGYHVHPAMSAVAFAAKGPRGVVAISDGTAGVGLASGATARLGRQVIHVREEAVFLDDGTLAGSTLTMDRAFRHMVTRVGRSLVEAVAACSTTPASALGLASFGAIADGAAADLVVLDRGFGVVCTLIDGHEVYRRPGR